MTRSLAEQFPTYKLSKLNNGREIITLLQLLNEPLGRDPDMGIIQNSRTGGWRKMVLGLILMINV